MPKFYEVVSSRERTISDEHSKTKSSKSSALIYLLAFFYFAFSCGMEGFFQSQTFTFGICGPHRLLPKKAAILTTVYFASFLLGR